MQKLLSFIIAKRHWFLLIICEVISLTLIYQHNAYQRNKLLSAANAITGRISAVSSTVFSYFELQQVNQELLERNSRLEMEMIRLNEQISNLTAGKSSFSQVFLKDTVLADSMVRSRYTFRYIPARVVNNSIYYQHNHITINKGSNDGIRPDMGVVSPQGIVGIVTNVNDRFSVAMSLLNVKTNVSCKIMNTRFFGRLSWKGGNVRYAFLEEIQTHAVFQVGDTIVTSGYSDCFPPGIMVGVIESYNKQDDDNFYSLKVRLSVDFHTLNAINVIDNQLQYEQKELEREARKND